MRIKLKEVLENVFYVQFSNYREIKQACMRFEEAYENPIYRFKKYKKGFTKKQIKVWWKTTSEGKKHAYWFDAFNIPSYILTYFYSGKFNPVDKYEQALLDILKPIYKKRKKFYVIATVSEPKQKDFKHEVSHGLWHISKEYKKEVIKIISKIDKKTIRLLDRWLYEGNGYDKSVLEDERHAWLLADDRKDLEKSKIKFDKIKEAKKALNQLFDKTFEKLKK